MAAVLRAKPGSRNVVVPVATMSRTLRGAVGRGQWANSELRRSPCDVPSNLQHGRDQRKATPVTT